MHIFLNVWSFGANRTNLLESSLAPSPSALGALDNTSQKARVQHGVVRPNFSPPPTEHQRARDERCTSVPLRLEAGVNLPAQHADTSFAGADRVGPRHRGGCDTGVATLGCLIASERLAKLVAIGAENQRPSVRQLLSSRADINHGTDLKEWCRRRNDYTCTY